ncbi:MAG TPA: phosphoribosyl-AMP cyclohydrolase [Candidatus Limnocylindrales bacterium]|nr:phosphoribosyl-AMP cyclohydrolase [Candidatus Limnocylindrales bacterium]
MTALRFDSNGLIPAIVQDAENNEVLMMGYMNRTALEKTFETGKVYFWSRSRKKLWTKGETSGHYQFVREVFLDCDGDCLLIKVEQVVGACHEGYRSCFYRRLEKDLETSTIIQEKVFDEKKVYGS